MPRSRAIANALLPAWTNKLRWIVALAVLLGGPYVVLLVAFGGSTVATDVGYAPVQPIPYSHAVHVGQLGMDCRYCHTAVEVAAHANVPPTATCINCHNKPYGIRQDSPKLARLYESFYGSERQPAGLPIPWVRVHDLPDYVYFNHAAHVTRGVGCVECHGRVDRMEVVYQAERLSMSWCLDCHRNPGPRLRPLDKITDMTWQRPAGAAGELLAQNLLQQYSIRDVRTMQSCSLCHR